MTETTETPAPAAPAAPADPAAAPAAAPDWLTGLPEDLRADATLGKYDSVEKLSRAHLEAKRALGAKGIPAPKGADDTEGLSAALRALGAPEAAAGYNLQAPEGGDATLLNGFAEAAARANLLPSQVNAVLDFWNAATADMETARATAARQQAQADETALRAEWGDRYDANIELGRRALREIFAGDQALVDAFESAAGFGKVIKGFARIGALLGEDPTGHLVHGAAGGAPAGAAAQAELDALKKDAGFRQKLADNDVEAVKRWQALNAAVAAELDRRAAAA